MDDTLSTESNAPTETREAAMPVVSETLLERALGLANVLEKPASPPDGHTEPAPAAIAARTAESPPRTWVRFAIGYLAVAAGLYALMVFLIVSAVHHAR